MEKGKYVIVRADRAGVFAGTIVERQGTEIVLSNARRIWYWDGAASISQLAVTGPMKPDNCKFPAPVSKILVLGVIEVIECTEKARKVIEGVREWKK